jgi:hypothetical protein
MTKDAKTAAKMEKKLKILLGGYQVSKLYLIKHLCLNLNYLPRGTDRSMCVI